MNKRVFDIGYACINLLLTLAFGFVIAQAQESQTQTKLFAFIPVAENHAYPGQHIAGRVVSQHNMLMAEATMRNDEGQSMLSDRYGEYSPDGCSGTWYTGTPALDGMMVSPASNLATVLLNADHMGPMPE